MKTFFLTLLFASSAAFAGPIETVRDAFNRVVTVVQGGTRSNQVSAMCGMVNKYVAVDHVSRQVLGAYYAKDPEGVREFKEIVPSVIVTDMQSVAEYLDAGFTLGTKTVPRGSGSVGVPMNIEVSPERTLKLIVVVTQIGGKWMITNVESISYRKNMVLGKRAEYANIMGQTNRAPVRYLVDTIKRNSGLVICR